MKNFSLLHISDLHRTQDYVSNEVLITSIEHVLDSYNGNDWRPSLIIVSGDLVQGSKSSDEAKVVEELDKQYQEAGELLDELTRIYLGGDRNKVVMIPGNHDVSFYHSRMSMKKEEPAAGQDPIHYKKWLLKQMGVQRSRIRWSWQDFEFYHIVDESMYERRFEAFCRFYENFYRGERRYTLAPGDQFDCYDFEDLNLVVIGYNSCHDNDHCNYSGAIHPDALAKAERLLKGDKYRDRLRIAVWHHHTSGNPQKSDYMDNRTLQHLMRANFHVGMHGHAHITGVAYEPSRIQSDQQMIVISAGSLCAGGEELPTGELRSFNVVQFDNESRKAIVDIYRDSMQGLAAFPTWIKHQQVVMNYYYPAETLTQSKQKETLHIHTKEMPSQDERILQLVEAEQMIMESQYDKALVIVGSLEKKDPYVRRLLMQCYQGLHMHNEIIELFTQPEPEGAEEIISLIRAAQASGRTDLLKEILQMEAIQECDDHFVKQIVQKYRRFGAI
ncbi:metallophosphoesterase [Paenibacillus sp. YYML68]|uniref:metallophosphoesterase family protein n=1 Tax=Paenibacillus sp. YYML68 TaxID=2909250 RepID=UPI00248FB7F9|nr:metallophosphoesterase [Paenibacillus sp. YYML68]